jgi:hypothetical protein
MDKIVKQLTVLLKNKKVELQGIQKTTTALQKAITALGKKGGK